MVIANFSRNIITTCLSVFKRIPNVNWNEYYSNPFICEDARPQTINIKGYSYEQAMKFFKMECGAWFNNMFKVYEHTVNDIETMMVFYNNELSQETTLILRANKVVACQVSTLNRDFLLDRSKGNNLDDNYLFRTSFYKKLLSMLSTLNSDDPYYPSRYQFIHILYRLLRDNHNSYLNDVIYNTSHDLPTPIRFLSCDSTDVLFTLMDALSVNSASKRCKFLDKYIKFIDLENKYGIYSNETLTTCITNTSTLLEQHEYQHQSSCRLLYIHACMLENPSFMIIFDKYLLLHSQWCNISNNNRKIPDWIYSYVFDYTAIIQSLYIIDFLIKNNSETPYILEDIEPYIQYLKPETMMPYEFKKVIYISKTLNMYMDNLDHKNKFMQLCYYHYISITNLYNFCTYLRSLSKLQENDIMIMLTAMTTTMATATSNIVFDKIRNEDYTNLVISDDNFDFVRSNTKICPFWKSNSLILE